MGFINIRPVRFFFRSLHVLNLFMICGSKRRSQLGNYQVRCGHLCFFKRDPKSHVLSFQFSHGHFQMTAGHVITFGWSLRNHFSFATCRSSLTIRTVSTNQTLQSVCSFLCHETVVTCNTGCRPFSVSSSANNSDPRHSTEAAHPLL